MAFHLALLAGGRGTRFWPLSRRRRPKQLLPLLGDTSLLRRSYERIAPLAAAERCWTLSAADLVAACRRQLPEIPSAQVLGEPQGRNTAPAIALAAVLAAAADPQAVLGIFPSDHFINDAKAFRRVARLALRRARDSAALVTLGVPPDRPETGYGYIETAAPAEMGSPQPVRRFVEKPGPRRARQFQASGRFLWNSGMFFASAKTLRREFLAQAPGIWERVAPLARDFGTRRFRAALAAAYAEMPAVSFDVAIVEKARAVEVIPAEMGWSDVGNWIALAALLDAQQGNRVSGQVMTLDAQNNIIVDREGFTALVGVKDLVIVRSAGALLVCHRKRAQSLRELVADLAAHGFSRYQ